MSRASTRPFSAELQLLHPSERHGRQQPDPLKTNPRHDEIIEEIRKLREELMNGAISAAEPAHTDATDEPVESAAKIAEAVRLKSEIEVLSDAIQTTKQEIAALRNSNADTDRISDVTFELDAVVSDTESATEAILGSCESIEQYVETLELQASSTEERGVVEEIGNLVVKIYEACNFQDITGQRISKVVGALSFIEERIDSMMEIWGGDEVFSQIEVPEGPERDEDQMLLNGPAGADSESASQADIDALFD